jgi:mono/diheme cytochrome c family protein
MMIAWIQRAGRPAAVLFLPWLVLAPMRVWAAHPTNDPDPAALYHNYCSVCHGDKGDGRSRAAAALVPAPRDFTSDAARRELSRERIFAAIKHGRPGTAMVGWSTQLADGDMQKLADYVLATFVRREQAGDATAATLAAAAATPSAPVKPNLSAAFPNGLKGDAKKGGAFYQANCATCHGPRGDGQGPRAYFINPKPKSFIDDAARVRYNRPSLYAFVSEGKLGTEMPAWRQVIDPQQIADVSEYVLRTFIASPAPAPATRAAPTGAAAKK